MAKRQLTVLSIEDNRPDFDLLETAIKTSIIGKDIEINIINIQNGKKSLDFLNKKNGYKESLTPDIIILDINLPRISGIEVLKYIKKTPELLHIPVIILSTSDSEKDIKECYKFYANSYITKTFNFEDLLNKISIMIEYWFEATEIPKNQDAYIIYNNEKDKKK